MLMKLTISSFFWTVKILYFSVQRDYHIYDYSQGAVLSLVLYDTQVLTQRICAFQFPNSDSSIFKMKISSITNNSLVFTCILVVQYLKLMSLLGFDLYKQFSTNLNVISIDCSLRPITILVVPKISLGDPIAANQSTSSFY